MNDDSRPADPAARVRQLLLSGDNIIKNRSGDQRYERALERFLRARQIAESEGLDEALRIIDLRLAGLPKPQ